jgi:hypothetical protein
MRSDISELGERTEHGFVDVRGALDATTAGQAHIVELLTEALRRDT